mgnify:FL=1
MRAKTSYLRAIRLFLVLLSLCAAVFGIYFCFGQSKGINRSGLTMLNELARQRSCGLCVALESKLQQTPRDITDALKNKDATALAALRRAAADARVGGLLTDESGIVLVNLLSGGDTGLDQSVYNRQGVEHSEPGGTETWRLDGGFVTKTPFLDGRISLVLFTKAEWIAEILQPARQERRAAGICLGFAAICLAAAYVTLRGFSMEADSAAMLAKLEEQGREIECLQERVRTDGPTGLYAKDATERLIEDALMEKKNGLCALMLMDIDDLKGINDTLGHAAGDRVIKSFACALRELFGGARYIVGRVGGDEFMVLIRKIKTRDQATVMLRDAALRLSDRNTGRENGPSVSIGMAVAFAGETSFQTLYRQADCAMYDAKKRKETGYAVFCP